MARLGGGWWAALLVLSGFGCAALEPKEAGQEVRVLSYNIHHGEGTDGVFDLERIAAVILESGADLVALQEVDVGTSRAGGVDQAQELARLTGMEVRFAEAIPYAGGSYGDAVLSRWPIHETVRLQLPAEPGHELRVAVGVVVEPVEGATLFLVGTHLDHTRDPSDRVRQVETLLGELAGSDHPTLLVGDLNATPESAPMRLLLEAGWTAADPTLQPTFPSEVPERKIDWILMGPGQDWTTLSVEVLEAPVASDHAPLVATLRLATPSTP